MIRAIVMYPDPRLKEDCAPIEELTDDVAEFFLFLAEGEIHACEPPVVPTGPAPESRWSGASRSPKDCRVISSWISRR